MVWGGAEWIGVPGARMERHHRWRDGGGLMRYGLGAVNLLCIHENNPCIHVVFLTPP